MVSATVKNAGPNGADQTAHLEPVQLHAAPFKEPQLLRCSLVTPTVRISGFIYISNSSINYDYTLLSESSPSSSSSSSSSSS